MPLARIQFRPGINRESTSFASEQGWFDSDLIRFRKGHPEKIGGWSNISSGSILGTVRSLKTWVTLEALKLMGVGTNSKFYIEQGTAFNDITPIRSTATLGADPFTTGSAGSGIITVVAVGHGAFEGDFVTFSGATAVDGLTIADLNKEHVITQVVSPNSYTVDTGGSASSGATAGGGSAVIANYQISVGAEGPTANGPGFGAGFFGGTTLTFSMTTLNGAINDSVTSIILTSATDFETAASTTGAAVAVVDATITVVDSSGFPSKGTVKINSENIIYRTNSGTVLGDLTRAADGTTAALHGSGVAVTFVGLIQIDTELIQYTGKTSQTLDAGVVRGVRGTTAAAHDDGAVVKEANSFFGNGSIVATFFTNNVRRLWSQDNFGEDLILNVRDADIYYWDASLGLANRAIALSAQTDASDAPTIARQIIVSDADRHVVAFGCNTLGTTVQDLLLVRWSDQESSANWTPTAINTAGSLRLSSGSEIITAVETRQQILIWTDASIYSMRYVGPPFTFSINLVANNASIIAPNAVVAVGDRVYWMDTENFFTYGGQIQAITCSLLRFVFDDINLDESSQFFAASNRSFDEIFWFYCSSGSILIDRYVKYNYADNTWDIGALSRTAWVDFGIQGKPRGSEVVNGTTVIYDHETGTTANGVAMTPFIESSVFSIGDGEQFTFITRIIPDLDLTSADATTSVNYIIKARDYPGDALTTVSTSAVTSTTNQSFVRSRSRSAVIRVESDALDIAWTLGDVRLDIRPDGRR